MSEASESESEQSGGNRGIGCFLGVLVEYVSVVLKEDTMCKRCFVNQYIRWLEVR